MDFVSRAKALLMSQARTAALVIMPLAAAVETQAAAFLPTGSPTCDANDNGSAFSCSGGAAPLPEYNGITGASLYTSGPVFFFSGGLAQLTLATSGFLNESISGGSVIPLKFDFNLNAFSGASITDWTLTLSIIQSLQSDFQLNTASVPGSAVITGTGSDPTSGTALLTVPAEGYLAEGFTIVSGQLDVNWGGFGTISIDVPAGSTFDFNLQIDNGVPEPATTGLAGLGLALAAGYRLIKRKDGFQLFRK